MYKDLRQRYYVYKPMYNKTNVNSQMQQRMHRKRGTYKTLMVSGDSPHLPSAGASFIPPPPITLLQSQMNVTEQIGKEDFF